MRRGAELSDSALITIMCAGLMWSVGRDGFWRFGFVMPPQVNTSWISLNGMTRDQSLNFDPQVPEHSYQMNRITDGSHP